MDWKDIDTGNICPVCGLILDFMPWDQGTDSLEICPCCGNQFGYTDASSTPDGVMKRWKDRRDEWIKNGMKWWAEEDGEPDERKPQNWDPQEQLKNIPSEFLDVDEKY